MHAIISAPYVSSAKDHLKGNWRPKLEASWFISQSTGLLSVERGDDAYCYVVMCHKYLLGHISILMPPSWKKKKKSLFSQPNPLVKATQDKPGFETISSLQSGLYLTTLGMMNLKIFTLRWTKLRRLSPSCLRAPAVTMTSLECAVTL